MISQLRDAAHSLGDRQVELPRPVADRLGLPSRSGRSAFLQSALDWLERQPARPLCTTPSDEVIYEVFLECFAGFSDERGSLYSFICHLPFIIDDLGASAILSLPLLTRGRSERKGRSSSPFAIARREQIDPDLGGFDDAISAQEVWTCLTAACRRIGVRLGMVLPMATIAIDSELIRTEPELVFWWHAGLDEHLTGTPTGDARMAPEAVPVGAALQRFTDAPRPEQVDTLGGPRGMRYVAHVDGAQLTVANAYPDPIVRNDATYCWSDVAALRFGRAITPQAYRQSGVDPMSAAIGRHIAELVAGSQRRGEKILLADVSSALPDQALVALCQAYPEMIVIAEQLWSFCDRAPFEFITGPLIPCVAAHHRDPEVLAGSLVHHLDLLASTPDGPRFLAGVSNHDTLPCPTGVSECLLTIFTLLPGSIPFLYSGTEWGSPVPTNLEFGSFDREHTVPQDGLLLFNHRPIAADGVRLAAFSSFWRDLLAMRRSLGTATLPRASLHKVERLGLLVSFHIGPQRLLVNLGSASVVVDTPSEGFAFIVGACAFDVDPTHIRIPRHGVVIVGATGSRAPSAPMTVFRCVDGAIDF